MFKKVKVLKVFPYNTFTYLPGAYILIGDVLAYKLAKEGTVKIIEDKQIDMLKDIEPGIRD